MKIPSSSGPISDDDETAWYTDGLCIFKSSDSMHSFNNIYVVTWKNYSCHVNALLTKKDICHSTKFIVLNVLKNWHTVKMSQFQKYGICWQVKQPIIIWHDIYIYTHTHIHTLTE